MCSEGNVSGWFRFNIPLTSDDWGNLIICKSKLYPYSGNSMSHLLLDNTVKKQVAVYQADDFVNVELTTTVLEGCTTASFNFESRGVIYVDEIEVYVI